MGHNKRLKIVYETLDCEYEYILSPIYRHRDNDVLISNEPVKFPIGTMRQIMGRIFSVNESMQYRDGTYLIYWGLAEDTNERRNDLRYEIFSQLIGANNVCQADIKTK